MAISRVPTAWIANYSSNDTNMTLPIASFSGLTAAEANTTTGDICNIVKEILEVIYAAQQDLDSADRPTKMSVARLTTTDDGTGIVTRQFTVTFTCSSPTLNVATEE